MHGTRTGSCALSGSCALRVVALGATAGSVAMPWALASAAAEEATSRPPSTWTEVRVRESASTWAMCLAKSESAIGRDEKMHPFAFWRPRPCSSARWARLLLLPPRPRPDGWRHGGERKAPRPAAVGCACGSDLRLSGSERFTHSYTCSACGGCAPR